MRRCIFLISTQDVVPFVAQERRTVNHLIEMFAIARISSLCTGVVYVIFKNECK